MVQIAEARHHRGRFRRSHGVILSGSYDREANKNRETEHTTQSRDAARSVPGTTRKQFHTQLLLKQTKRTSILDKTSALKAFSRKHSADLAPEATAC
jgi:hypothetical protein